MENVLYVCEGIILMAGVGCLVPPFEDKGLLMKYIRKNKDRPLCLLSDIAVFRLMAVLCLSELLPEIALTVTMKGGLAFIDTELCRDLLFVHFVPARYTKLHKTLAAQT